MIDRDRLWLWGTVVNALQKDYGFSESQMSVGDAVQSLGLSNAIMAGFLPPNEEEYAAVAECDGLLWEMSFDEGFSFEKQLAPIVKLHERHENVRGVLLDDFSTTEISSGAQPDVLARMRSAMPDSLELWIVVYSMSLDIPNLSEYLKHVDGVSFWVWSAEDLARLPDWVARCNALSGNKPMNLGMYFYDFGGGKPMTIQEMEQQLATGVSLIESGACQDLTLLSSSIMDIGLETIPWIRDWIRRQTV
jgi:hypothetical protein